MCPTITVEPADEISEASRVCHYDELDQRTKERFPQLAESTETPVSEPIADGLRGYDVVKYTDYYAVSL